MHKESEAVTNTRSQMSSDSSDMKSPDALPKSLPKSSDYDTLRNSVVQTLRQGGGSRASVLQVSWQGHDYVMKDYHDSSAYFRYLIAPFMIRRESNKLKQLAGIEGVPQFITSWRHVLIMEYRDAVRPSKRNFNEVQWALFEKRLYQLIDDMHQAGVAHADLRSPGNVIVTNDYQPVIIDFVASLSYPKKLKWLFAGLFKKISQIDKTAVIKIKKRVVPELLTEQEKEKFHQDKSRGKWFRAVIDNGRKWFQK